jgi:hypothetical protein
MFQAPLVNHTQGFIQVSSVLCTDVISSTSAGALDMNQVLVPSVAYTPQPLLHAISGTESLRLRLASLLRLLRHVVYPRHGTPLRATRSLYHMLTVWLRCQGAEQPYLIDPSHTLRSLFHPVVLWRRVPPL